MHNVGRISSISFQSIEIRHMFYNNETIFYRSLNVLSEIENSYQKEDFTFHLAAEYSPRKTS